MPFVLHQIQPIKQKTNRPETVTTGIIRFNILQLKKKTKKLLNNVNNKL